MKATILDRLTTKSVKNETKQGNVVVAIAPRKGERLAKATKQANTEIDPNSPAKPTLTYALYQANRAASKINGCEVYNDWHKQGLTHKEALELIAEYNKVTGYVFKPKQAEVKATKVTTPKASEPSSKGAIKGQPNDLKAQMRAKLQAIADLRKEGYSEEDIKLLM